MAKDTYIPRNELVDMNKEINQVRQKAKEELIKLPGVLAVGVGLKEVKGELQRELCFKVTVDKKRIKSEMRSKDFIPEDIYGFKTDVNEAVLSISSSIDSTKYRPLFGGCQIESSSYSVKGTLGCFAKRNADNKIVVLSNWHVMVGNPDNIDGDRIGQPSHSGCCSCCSTNEIGETLDGRLRTDNMDAAIALLDGQDSDTIPEYRYLNEVLNIGTLAGSVAPIPGEMVWKRGRTTGFTQGQLGNDTVPHGTLYKFYNNLIIQRTDQWEISPVGTHTNFILEGDSGSVSVNENNQVVLLNFSFVENLHKSYGTNIQEVESILQIKVIDSSFHTGVADKGGVPLSSINAPASSSSLADAFEQLETEIGHFREGKRMLELFKIHRAELLDLVRHRREVMAAWNRYQGPAYLAHIARSVRRENKPVPEQIKGITLQSLLLKMTAVLQRNGSPELAQSVTENYLQIMKVLSSGRTPEDWKAYLAQLDQMAHA